MRIKVYLSENDRKRFGELKKAEIPEIFKGKLGIKQITASDSDIVRYIRRAIENLGHSFMPRLSDICKDISLKVDVEVCDE